MLFRTRWTLTVCFKALPWQPAPCFTGISDYTIDDQARVVRQVDFWDSINLVQGREGGDAVSPPKNIKPPRIRYSGDPPIRR